MSTEKYYGVATGDGNNGVSHVFPNYIVKTDDPFRLAEKAARAEFKQDINTQQWLDANLEIEGEEETVISATCFETLEMQEERVKIEDAIELLSSYLDKNLARKLESVLENLNPEYAYFILEVFPIDCREKYDFCPVYESIEEAI